jgi:hypothetical protein
MFHHIKQISPWEPYFHYDRPWLLAHLNAVSDPNWPKKVHHCLYEHLLPILSIVGSLSASDIILQPIYKWLSFFGTAHYRWLL